MRREAPTTLRVAGVLALVAAVTFLRYREPAPVDADAAVDRFSAARARTVLASLLADGQPHPVGTPSHARVRDAISAELERLGYAPQRQSDFACGPMATCARVENVLGRLEGREPGAVLLVAHYDSIGSSPGASDNGAGVAAALEVARALKASPPPRHTVLFLFSDAEEFGMIGAAHFAAHHPWAAEVRAVVNLDAVGSGGPSVLVETSHDSAWLIRHFAKVNRPVASSALGLLAEMLGFTTDFTIFSRSGVPALNLLNLRESVSYHTGLDDLAHVTSGSIQHRGDTALGAIRAFANSNLESPPTPGEAVWTDVLATFVLSWPKAWSVWLASLAAVLEIVAFIALKRRGLVSLRSGLLGATAWLGVMLLSVALAWVLQSLGLMGSSVAPPPLPIVAAFCLIPLVVAALVLGISRRWLDPWGAWLGGGWLCAAFGVAASVLAPEVSPLLLPPVAIALACLPLALRIRSGPSLTLAALVPAASAAALWLPWIGHGLDLGGAMALPFVTVVVAALAATSLPLFVRADRPLRRPVLVGAFASILVAGAAAYGATLVSSAPLPVNLLFEHDENTDTDRWLLESPAELHPPLLGREWTPGATFPWAAGEMLASPAPKIDEPTPELVVLDQSASPEERHLRLRLRARPEARAVSLYVAEPSRIGAVSIEGQPVSPPLRAPWENPDWQGYTCYAPPQEGLVIDLQLRGSTPVELFIQDNVSGLPSSASELLKKRVPPMLPFHDGDSSLSTRRLEL